ncbi:MAG: hypothetical protein ACK6DI_11085 [Betaproteobacteria bacterium]
MHMMAAPILSRRTRIVAACARQSGSGQRQRAQPLDQRVGRRREEQPQLIDCHLVATGAGAEQSQCTSLIRFSASPRAQ